MTPRSSSRSLRRLLLPAAATAAVLGVAVPATAEAAPTTTCSTHWGSLAKSGGRPDTTPPLGVALDLRPGRHACYDRLVIDLGEGSDPTVQYRVSYVRQVTADGSGAPVHLAGGAFLQIEVNADAHDVHGNPTVPTPHLTTPGYRTFREIREVGDFEGTTTVGLGVRARLPYRAFTLPGAPGSGDGARLVVDVAHTW